LNELDKQDAEAMMVETHGMNPMKVLGMVKSMGGEFKRILLVGCEPAPLLSEDGHMGLSEPVQAAVNEAIEMVQSLVTKILEEHRQKATV
jgi:hydrogenase maturation protease